MNRHLRALLLLPALVLPLAAQDGTPAEAEALVKERIELAKAKGKGWHDYKYMNPKTGVKEPKTSYIEVWNGCIFGAGIYKK